MGRGPSATGLATGRTMNFRLVNEAKKKVPVHRLCRVLGVSQSGCFAWRERLACCRQHEDMVLLAHVRTHLAKAAVGS